MYSGASLCLEQKFVLKEFVFKGSDCTCMYSGVLLCPIVKEFVLRGFDCICKYSGVSLCLKQSFILKEFVLRGFDWIF